MSLPVFGSADPPSLDVYSPQVPIVPAEHEPLEHSVQFFLQLRLLVYNLVIIFKPPDIEAEFQIVSYAPEIRITGSGRLMTRRVSDVDNDCVECFANLQATNLVLQFAYLRTSKRGKPEQSGYLQRF